MKEGKRKYSGKQFIRGECEGRGKRGQIVEKDENIRYAGDDVRKKMGWGNGDE